MIDKLLTRKEADKSTARVSQTIGALAEALIECSEEHPRFPFSSGVAERKRAEARQLLRDTGYLED